MEYGSLLQGVSTADPTAIDESGKTKLWQLMDIPTAATGMSATAQQPDNLYPSIVGGQNGETLLPNNYWPVFSQSVPSICELKSVGLAASGLSTEVSGALFVFPVLGQKAMAEPWEDQLSTFWDCSRDWAVFSMAAPWLKPILERLQYLRGLPPQWDSHRAKPIHGAAFDRVLSFLNLTMTPRTAPPSVVPLESGGLQIEWHRAGLDVEIEFEVGSDAHIYVHELSSGEEQEAQDAVSVFTALDLSDRLSAGYDPADVD